jgi:hypothetical protein
MKFTFVRYALCMAAVGSVLGWPAVAFAGDDGDVLKQAEASLKQAWNPGGDAPSADDRIELLNEAIKLARSEPDRRLALRRMDAVRLMKLAIDDIKAGDPDNKVNGLLQDADRALRDAIGIAESH